MKHLIKYEKFEIYDIHVDDIIYYFIHAIDSGDMIVTGQLISKVRTLPISSIIHSRIHSIVGFPRTHLYDIFNDKTITHHDLEDKKTMLLHVKFHHPRARCRGSLSIDSYCKSIVKKYLGKARAKYNFDAYSITFNENSLDGDIMADQIVILQFNNDSVNESTNNQESHLLVVDVQKSFKKYFTPVYLEHLRKYCSQFTNVYQVWDNHVDGKNPDTDYLYDSNPDIPIHNDLYTFPNQKDLIEKRYNYNVNADFYKKILDKETYKVIKSKEQSKSLKIGEVFKTKEDTYLVYVNNNHKWLHIPKKMQMLFTKLRGKELIIVGGSDGECLQDVYIAAQAFGVKIKRNHRYIWSASHCPTF